MARPSFIRRNPFAIIVVLLIAAYIIGATVSDSWAMVILGPVVAAVVLVAAWQNGASLGAMWILAGVCAVAQISLLVDAGFNDVDEPGFGNIMLATGLMVAPVFIVRELLEHTRVTSNTIFGAISVYILLGLAFADVYIAIQRLSDADFLAQGPLTSRSQAQYFSFITLTTTGFGDLSPAGDLPQSVVVLEALAGQLFLVTLLARLVSMYAGPAMRTARDEIRELRELRRETKQGRLEAGTDPDHRDPRDDRHDVGEG